MEKKKAYGIYQLDLFSSTVIIYKLIIVIVICCPSLDGILLSYIMTTRSISVASFSLSLFRMITVYFYCKQIIKIEIFLFFSSYQQMNHKYDTS
jgi:hypothetical protein